MGVNPVHISPFVQQPDEQNQKFGNENPSNLPAPIPQTNSVAQAILAPQNLPVNAAPLVLTPNVAAAQNPIVLSPVPDNINLHPIQNINLTPVNAVRPFSQTVITDANQLFLDARNARNRELLVSIAKWVITGLVICSIASTVFIFTGGIAAAGIILGVGVFTALIPSSIRYGIHVEGNTKKFNEAHFDKFCRDEYDKLVHNDPTVAIPLFCDFFENSLHPHYKKEGITEDSFEEFCQALYRQAGPNPTPQMNKHLQTIRVLEENLNKKREFEYEYLNKEFTPESREVQEIAKNPERLEFKEMCEAREDPNSEYVAYTNTVWNQYQQSNHATPKKDKISDVYRRFKNVASADQASKDIRLYRLFKEQKRIDLALNNPDPNTVNAAQNAQTVLYEHQDDLFAYYGRVLNVPRVPIAPAIVGGIPPAPPPAPLPAAAAPVLAPAPNPAAPPVGPAPGGAVARPAASSRLRRIWNKFYSDYQRRRQQRRIRAQQIQGNQGIQLP